ncbi:MAG: rhomboid family intramembrane serine protease, partial [Nocardioides sp.]
DASGVPTCYRHPDRETYISCQRCGRPICPDCMRDAAVGFQCPSCIVEGKKSTRSGRTTFGGLHSADSGLTSKFLIGINVAVWIAITVTGGASSRLVDQLSLRPRGACVVGNRLADVPHSVCSSLGGGWLPGVSDGAWWQLLTSVFTHVAIIHIGFNMLALWFLGPQLEQVLGRVRFLALYLLSGLAGSALVYWFSYEYAPTLGASGAVFGLMGALLVLALKMGVSPQGILFWVGINFAFTFAGPSNISWQGHVGGFLAGALLALILAYAPRPRRTVWQAAGLSLVGVAIAVAFVARTLALT